MSMNLHCEEVELWQTPTYISYMCYSNEDGGWEGILYRYIEWVKNYCNGVWEDQQDLEAMRERVNAHIAKLKKHPVLNFYVA